MSRRLVSHHRCAEQYVLTQGCLRVVTHEALPGVRLVTVIGEIDLATEPLLDRALWDAERSQADAVVLDLTKVGFLGLSGVGALLAAADRADRHGGRFGLVVATKPVGKTLWITGADGLLPCYPTLDAALRGIWRPPRQ